MITCIVFQASAPRTGGGGILFDWFVRQHYVLFIAVMCCCLNISVIDYVPGVAFSVVSCGLTLSMFLKKNTQCS